MAKRRSVSDESDIEEVPTASKRQRRDEEQEYEDDEAPKSSKKKANKGKGKKPIQSDDDADEDMDQPDAESENEFEQKHSERIRQSVEKKKADFTGSIADCGIIERVEMKEFMCHQNLVFNFGPRVNFIIGHNGSGKSAVLTAITVALGGKASATGRGSGLKAFIREGQSSAEVTIFLKNRGEDAFKHSEYGDKIVINRKFTKEGSSTWKIMNFEKKVVATTRDELQAICDHMNIQVDNPMNVLTQDSARQFLSASSPADKYKLFLRGTQLQQLSEEYEACRQNITSTAKMIEKKKEVIPDLRRAVEDANTKYDEAKLARTQRQQIDEIKKELAWAHVQSKKNELDAKTKEVEKLAPRIHKAETSRDEAKATFDARSNDVAELEQQFHSFGSSDELNQRKQEVADELKRGATRITEINREQRKMNDDIKRMHHSIKGYEEQIRVEVQKLAAREAGRQEELRAKLDEVTQAFKAAEQRANDTLRMIREQDEIANNARREGSSIEGVCDGLKKQIQNTQHALNTTRQARDNVWAAYVGNMGAALHDIERTRWQGEAPIGPLGRYVKVRDRKWVDAIRTVLGGRMHNFIVSDPRDRQTLKGILDRHQCAASSIVVTSRDNFDFSAGEPAAHLTTFLRVLEISDPFVLRTLVNVSAIERTLLFDTRREASQVLQGLSGRVVAYSLDGFQVQSFGDGGEQSTPSPMRRNHQSLFPESNTQNQERQFQEDLARLNEELKSKQQELGGYQEQFRNAQRLRVQYANDAKIAKQQASQAKSRQAAVQTEVNDEQPIEIAGIEEVKAEEQREIESLKLQFEATAREKQEIEESHRPLMQEQEQIRKQLREFAGQKNAVQNSITAAAEERLKAEHAMKYWQTKLDDESKQLKEAQEAEEVLKVEFEDWTKNAAEFCTRVENPRTVTYLQRQLDAKQAALKLAEQRQGMSIDEIAQQVLKAKQALETADKELRQMANVNKLLRTAIHNRIEKWHEFRRHIALRTKHIFQYHLSNRGYWGKVMFNHEQATLSLKVQTDDQAGTQAKEKDPRSLSGGEKSFATICLLLALWEAIGCPIRCLDEFDVYMDAVNRRVTMRMMIETARTSDKKQYVLITPQDMSNVTIERPFIEVHRMADPLRNGQTQLPFTPV